MNIPTRALVPFVADVLVEPPPIFEASNPPQAVDFGARLQRAMRAGTPDGPPAASPTPASPPDPPPEPARQAADAPPPKSGQADDGAATAGSADATPRDAKTKGSTKETRDARERQSKASHDGDANDAQTRAAQPIVVDASAAAPKPVEIHPVLAEAPELAQTNAKESASQAAAALSAKQTAPGQALPLVENANAAAANEAADATSAKGALPDETKKADAPLDARAARLTLDLPESKTASKATAHAEQEMPRPAAVQPKSAAPTKTMASDDAQTAQPPEAIERRSTGAGAEHLPRATEDGAAKDDAAASRAAEPQPTTASTQAEAPAPDANAQATQAMQAAGQRAVEEHAPAVDAKSVAGAGDRNAGRSVEPARAADAVPGAARTQTDVAVKPTAGASGPAASRAEHIVQIFDRFRTIIEAGKYPGDVTVRTRDGIVRAHVELSGSRVNIQFSAEHPGLREAIKSSLGDLRSTLADRGLHMGDVGFGGGGTNSDARGEGRRAEDRGDGVDEPTGVATRGAPAASGTAEAPAARQRAVAGNLDLLG